MEPEARRPSNRFFAIRFRRPYSVRRTQVRENGQQIVVGTDVVPRHLPICENWEEDINDVVRERPAVAGIARRAPGIIGEDVWQESRCDSICFFSRVAARMFQRVGKYSDETGIVHRLASHVETILLAAEEDSLRGPRAPVRLNPFSTCAVQCAMP
jgi:hypothetical protein